jgi:hypothetical protein
MVESAPRSARRASWYVILLADRELIDDRPD